MRGKSCQLIAEQVLGTRQIDHDEGLIRCKQGTFNGFSNNVAVMNILEQHIQENFILASIARITHFIKEFGMLFGHISSCNPLNKLHLAKAVFPGILHEIILYLSSGRADNVYIY